VNPTDICDVAIVGGGPAGLAAAVAARSWQLKVCLIDEQPRFGGQIYRQPPRDFKVRGWLAGSAYSKGKDLLERAEKLTEVRHIAPATAVALFPANSQGGSDRGHHILHHDEARLGRVRAKHVLLATGCYETPVPFEGWQLPGVMSAGGIQTLLKGQRVAPGRCVVLAGTHPLLFVVAHQLLAADVKIASIVIAHPALRVLRALREPGTVAAAASQLPLMLAAARAVRRARVPVLFGHAVVEAIGSSQVQAVRIRRCNDGTGLSDRTVACDALGVCYGFLPSSELARQAGAQHQWLPTLGWCVDTDELMRTTVPGIHVAGELTGVAGAEAAALSGEIAGIGIASDMGVLSPDDALQRTRPLRQRLDRLRAFGRLLADLAQPPPILLAHLAQRPVVVCRCEDVTVGDVLDALDRHEMVTSANTAKQAVRVGMGLCQGRMCELSVRRLIAARRGCAIEQVPGFTVRPFVKPVPIGCLANDVRAPELHARDSPDGDR